MKIAIVGEPTLNLDTLKSSYKVENIDANELQKNIEKFNLIILSTKIWDTVPVLDIPKNCTLLNHFIVGQDSIEKFNSVNDKPDQLNFLVEFPGMRTRYLEEALEAALLQQPFKPNSLDSTNQFFDITLINKITAKARWLNNFQEEITKRILTDNVTFFKGITTILDELVMNSFVHGYKTDLEDPKGSPSGKVIVRWGLDQHNIVIKVSDFAGTFNFLSFLKTLKSSRSADEVVGENPGGLGLLMMINFVDHIEISSIKGTQTIVKLFIDLDRVLLARRRRPQKGSILLKSTPLVDDFD